MAERSQRERLAAEEVAAWEDVVGVLDRIPPAETDVGAVTDEGWTVRDVVFHLAAWADEAAAQLAAIREDRYERSNVDTDTRNEEYLRAGRALAVAAARVRLERARARALAEWSVAGAPSAVAVEWFAESGAEHYAEHLPDLRAFAERVGSDERPGAAARRAALVAAEAEGWAEIEAVVASLAPDAIERPGVTPDGWTVKDTMWHIAMWWEDFLDAVPRFADPAFDPDDETAEAVEERNRVWFEESRELSLDGVRERWTSSREAGVRAFEAMEDPSRTAERWFEECGTIHYEKHLIDLRPWATSARLPGSGRGAQ